MELHEFNTEEKVLKFSKRVEPLILGKDLNSMRPVSQVVLSMIAG